MTKTVFWLTTLALLLVLGLVVAVNKTGFITSPLDPSAAATTAATETPASGETTAAGETPVAGETPANTTATELDPTSAAQISEIVYTLIRDDSKIRGVTYGSYAQKYAPACWEATFYPQSEGVTENTELPDPCEQLQSAQINLESEAGKQTLPIAEKLPTQVRAIHLNGDGWLAIIVGDYMCVSVQLKGNEIGTKKKGDWTCTTLSEYKRTNPEGLEILFQNINWDSV